MKITRTIIVAATAALALTLGGCWDDDDDEVIVPPVVTSDVPDSAGVSAAAFISYLLTLGASDESSEPSNIRDVFAVPADDGSEPTPLT